MATTTADLAEKLKRLKREAQAITGKGKGKGGRPKKSIDEIADAASKSTDSGYLERMSKNAARARTKGEVARNIGKLRGPKDQARFDACKTDLERFLKTYMPTLFRLRFSDDHRRVIAKCQECVASGGLHAFAMPRGSGKSSIACGTCLWATMHGHLEFVNLIGSDAPAAMKLMKILKFQLQRNDLLLEDFYELCWPIREIGNSPQRVPGQTYTTDAGEVLNTSMVWTADEIAFPAIQGHPGASGYAMVAGLTGGLRGVTFIRPIDGRVVRPRLVILDDSQTRESSGSLSQTENREAIIMGDVLSMAGPDQDIAALMPCTVINKGDLADKFLDQKQHPEWNGTKTRLMNAMPTNKERWDEYRTIQVTYDPEKANDLHRAEDDATMFYIEHQAEMDLAGAPAWPERYGKREVSATQRAMNLLFRNEAAFWAEYQNEPLGDVADDTLMKSADIQKKVSGIPRGVVSEQASVLTAFIDVQESILYYAVCAWNAATFSGQCIDYGTWPDQRRLYFRLREADNTMARAMPEVHGQEAITRRGLMALTDLLLGREWPKQGGSVLRISKCLIDAGDQTDVVYEVCRNAKYSALLTPSKGIGIRAAKNPMSMWSRRPGSIWGPLPFWVEQASESRKLPHLIYDTNFWKSFMFARMAVDIGNPGALSLFGDEAFAKAGGHRMFADHLTSEKPIVEEVDGRKVTMWEKKPNTENHWLDAMTGCAAAASRVGVRLAEHAEAKKKSTARRSWADLQAKAAAAK